MAVRASLAAMAFVGLGLTGASGRDPGCGGVNDPQGGPNAPCTRSSDCGGGLVCLEGVCRDRDAGPLSPTDSGTDTGADVNAQDSSTTPPGDAGDAGD